MSQTYNQQKIKKDTIRQCTHKRKQPTEIAQTKQQRNNDKNTYKKDE